MELRDLGFELLLILFDHAVDAIADSGLCSRLDARRCVGIGPDNAAGAVGRGNRGLGGFLLGLAGGLLFRGQLGGWHLRRLEGRLWLFFGGLLLLGQLLVGRRSLGSGWDLCGGAFGLRGRRGHGLGG